MNSGQSSAPRGPEFRLYFDESGDHSTCSESDSVGKRYLGLVAVVFERGDVYRRFTSDLDALKSRHFHHDPDEPVILHREDVVSRKGHFWRLRDLARRRAFDDELISLLETTPFRLIGVAIDKAVHGRKMYRHLRHPYHYCLEALLERYTGWLNLKGRCGDVMAESRGKTEDTALKEAYSKMHKFGARYMPRVAVQKALTSCELKLKPKAHNVAGLQLADLLANPVTRDVLVDYRRLTGSGGAFTERMIAVVRAKYNRHIYRGTISGYGRVFLD